jgi:glycosyltransferase involved in cell wall biosynthesis
MTRDRQLRVGYMLADPGVDLSKQEGCRVHVERVVRGLRAAGHDVSFVAVQPGEIVLTDTGYGLQQFFEATRPAPLSSELLRLAHANHFPVSELGTSDLSFCAGRRVFRGCDVVHARLSPFDLGGLLCARGLQIPLVVEVNTPPLLEAKHFYPAIFNDRSERLAGFAASQTLAGAEAIVTVSSPLRDMLVADWNVPPGKITVLPNAADAPPPTPPRRLEELRLRHGLGPGPIIVFVGALQPWHGVEILLEAFDPVRLRHPDGKLLLVGDGPLRGLLEERVRTLDLRGSVRFTGAVEHERVSEFLDLADVAVAPYPRLPFDFYFSPIKIFEYMAAGRAIVASRIGQLAEILGNGETALLVEPGSSGELDSAIRRLLSDGELRRRLGEQARSKAEREHTWTGYASRLTDIYESLVGASRT